MLDYKNIKLIGSSHIAKESVKEIKNVCENLSPDILALELDANRLATLISENTVNKTKKNRNKKNNSKRYTRSLTNIFKIGINGFIFSLIGEYVEKKLGKIVGTKPGVDMMSAYVFAKKNKKKVALIDQDIKITLKNLSKRITWKEKWQFIKDLFNAFVLKKVDSGINLDDAKKLDLNKVPSEEIILSMMKETKRKYPTVYKSLVTDRNKVMAKNLVILSKKFPDQTILAVIGAGHEKEMKKIMKNIYNKVDVSVNNLEKKINAKANNSDNTSFSYKLNINT